MATEIERKFLVRKDLWYAIKKPAGVKIKQGYLLREPGKVIRVRVTDDAGFLTIKGATDNLTRPEYEFRIPIRDAVEILDQFTAGKIDKVRYEIPFEGKTWEIDEFFEENEGLILAEIELSSENESFSKPSWVGEEVTADPRYYNAYLAEKPFNSW